MNTEDLLRRALEQLVDDDGVIRQEFETSKGWNSPPIIEEIRAYLDAPKDKIEELRKENFALAAGQCTEGGPWGDEGGTVYCKYAENYARSEEPVAWMISDNCGTHFIEDKRDWYDAAGVESITPLYTHPKEWGGLTDDEIWEQWHTQPKEGAVMVPAFARAIEAKLKEKNT